MSDNNTDGSEEDPNELLRDVDDFIHHLMSSISDKSNAPDIPNCIESFLKKFDSVVSICENSGSISEDNAFFYRSIPLLHNLMNAVDHFPGDTKPTPCYNCASSHLHRAMCVLDDDFRYLLHKMHHHNPTSANPDPDPDPDPETISDHPDRGEFPGYSPATISAANKIATTMIWGGYQPECCLLYNALRRNAFRDQFLKLDYQNVSIDDVQKMSWEALEGEIGRWIQTVRRYSSTMYSGEGNLSTSIFSDYPEIARTMFHDITPAVTLRLVNFATAAALTKRSSEKLFKFLDMYESLSELISQMNDEASDDMKTYTLDAQCMIGEVAVAIFVDLENSIRTDSGRPVPSGAVHPLTRYTMNYLKYACEYKNTLEQVFQMHKEPMRSSEPEPETVDAGEKSKMSALSLQLMRIMDLLDANLETKVKQYKDPALRNIFMMNNGRYIVQKVKGAREIYEMMGQAWTRKRSSNLKMLHKNYQRETWGRVLQCISHEGVHVNGKVMKPVLKERFKSFNAMFDEIHKTQSLWVVSDEQLQTELRVSISAVVIPAYRAFLGRFNQHFDPGRQTEKYIKYQPEDIESMIEELFDGNPVSLSKKR